MLSPEEAPSADAAKNGSSPIRPESSEGLGELLEGYRQYLLRVANQELKSEVRAKVAASDLVQETFLRAHRDFEQFRGHSEAEIQAWLRRILLYHLANVTRGFCATDKRQLSREIYLGVGQHAENAVDSAASPSSAAAGKEQVERLRLVLARLPDDYRAVIQLRSYDRLEFAEVGQKLGRSAEAARKLWMRAVERLGEMMAE